MGEAQIEILAEPKNAKECMEKFQNYPLKGDATCPPAWDSFFCWPPTPAGSAVSFPCQDIFPFLQPAPTEVAVAHRRCGEEGLWSHGEWTNYSECERLDVKVEEYPISPLAVSYIIFIGSSASLLCLLVSLFIFCYFRTLQCSRIQVHRNLVLALILHAVLMLAISSPTIFGGMQHTFTRMDWLCKAVLSLKMYSGMTSIYWMFVEGLLLHSSVAVSVFRSEPPFRIYYIIGWGIPLVCVGLWLLLMALHSDKPCWRGYGYSPFLWLVTGPMIIALLVNTVFLINIIRILVTKLRTSMSVETKQIKKAAKATALLIPLLGITHLLFCINPGDGAEHVYMLVNAVLQSSQGLFVAVLYCFLNSEVQSVLSAAYVRTVLQRDTRRSCRSSRGSRVLGSMTSTSLTPEMPDGAGRIGRLSLLHKNSTTSPLKTLPEEEIKGETAFLS